MRTRDESKKEAIFEATIGLLNEIGFAKLSMAEIAKKAGVSPATIYIYFENKEDMLKKVYCDVMERFNLALSHGIDPNAPVPQTMEQVIHNILNFALEETSYFLFVEQFSNDPSLNASCDTATVDLMKPVFEAFERGQQQGIVRKADPTLLLSFCYYGTTQIAKDKLRKNQALSDSERSELIQICLNAIKI